MHGNITSVFGKVIDKDSNCSLFLDLGLRLGEKLIVNPFPP